MIVVHRKMNNTKFRIEKLSDTPPWRWILYAIVFVAIVVFLGVRFDPAILIGAPVGVLFILALFFGMTKLFQNERGRNWVLRNIGFLIGIFVILKVILFIWDRIEGK
jgi:hypothetical protein